MKCKYNKIRKYYDTVINNILVENKDIMIDAFVEYYGEEYRSIIKKRVDNAYVAYYFYFPYMKRILKNESDKDIKKIYTEHKKFLKTHKDKVKYNLVGSTKELNPTLKKQFKENAKQKNSYCISFYFPDMETVDLITFQALILEQVEIIHEFNHAISHSILGLVDDEVIDKSALDVTVSDDEERPCAMIDELINHKSSIEILDIFTSLGGDFLPICWMEGYESPYTLNFYLIDKFYEAFKEEIKIAKISDNLNYLVKKVGKENFFELVGLVNKYYAKDDKTIKKNKELSASEIDRVINKMIEYYSNDVDYTNEELQDFYTSLEKEGHNVRILKKEETR